MPITNPATRESAALQISSLGSWISFHTTDPGTTGGNEASGGGYARKQTTWTGGAADGTVTGSQVTIDVPAGAWAWLWHLVRAERRHVRGEVLRQLQHPVGGRSDHRHPHHHRELIMERITLPALEPLVVRLPAPVEEVLRLPAVEPLTLQLPAPMVNVLTLPTPKPLQIVFPTSMIPQAPRLAAGSITGEATVSGVATEAARAIARASGSLAGSTSIAGTAKARAVVAGSITASAHCRASPVHVPSVAWLGPARLLARRSRSSLEPSRVDVDRRHRQGARRGHRHWHWLGHGRGHCSSLCVRFNHWRSIHHWRRGSGTHCAVAGEQVRETRLSHRAVLRPGGFLRRGIRAQRLRAACSLSALAQ